MTAQRRDLVFAGRVKHKDGLVYAYYLTNERGQLNERAQLYSQPLGDFPPGAVCTYEIAHDGTAQPETAVYKRTWSDQTAVETWTIRHDAIMASENAWNAAIPKALDCMKSVREAYRQLDEERQNVLMAQVARYIVTPDDKS